MKSTSLSFVFVLLFIPCVHSTSYKEQCLTKFNNLISSFFAHAQISGLADVAMDEIIEEAPADDIIGAMINAAVGNLTGSQYSQFTSLMLNAYGKFGSYQAINDTIQKCLSGVNPPVSKLYPQITTQIRAQSTHSAKCNAGFKFFSGKLNTKFLHNIVTACKKKLSSTDWSKATSLLKNYIKFDKLGFKV